ncbi:uncharacterized protein TNCV_783021 [Trichonephila clavipes]|nr:uncharacterized protein TNCV_783021 [Trichonephila clavipes]
MPDNKIVDNGLFDGIGRLNVHLNYNKLKQMEHQHAVIDKRWMEIFIHFKNERIPYKSLIILFEFTFCCPGTNAAVESVFFSCENGLIFLAQGRIVEAENTGRPHVFKMVAFIQLTLHLTRNDVKSLRDRWETPGGGRVLVLPNHTGIEVYVGITFQDGDRFNSCQVIYSQFGLAIHQNDHQARRRFVEWAQNEIAVVPDFHKRILFSGEAHFWLNGYVNTQNCRIWNEANQQVYVETPLHPEKLTVWCALWAGGILLQKR